VKLIGLEGEGIKEIAEAARIKDRNHFEALVPRIYELGGKLPEDTKVFHDMSACPPASLLKDPTDIKAMLTVLVEAERCAVRGKLTLRVQVHAVESELGRPCLHRVSPLFMIHRAKARHPLHKKYSGQPSFSSPHLP
jgi:hypothetical protein